jgi:iduronate 2-sulfatase
MEKNLHFNSRWDTYRALSHKKPNFKHFFYPTCMKTFGSVLAILFVWVALAPGQTNKMNVLFIIADDLNCNIGAYDHYLVRTPNIDQLAREGLLFQNAFCNFPLCAPSRASFMTGLYPDQTGLKDLNTLVRERVPDVTTMPQNFMNHGYVSARVGKLFHYGNPGEIGTPGHDDPPSWNITVNPRGRDKDEEDKIFSLTPGSFGASLSWLEAEGEDEEQTDGIVATEAIRLLKKFADESTPFFLGVGFYKPHTPYVAPRKYFEMYSKEDIIIPFTPEGYLETLPVPAREVLTRWKVQNNLSEELALSAIQAYYACISFLDAQVGRVLNALDELGLKDNTIVVFTSDHGYHMGEHGYYQKLTLFENSDRMPLIISYPGQGTKGQVTHSLVEMIDFYPTLSELTGLSYPDYVAGRSMVPLLQDASATIRKSALSQISTQYISRMMKVYNGYTIRTELYRYSRWEEGGLGMTEFYDRTVDPEEMHNQAENPLYRDIIKSLDALLQDRIEEAGRKPEGLKVLPLDS